jgi:hypothetical protein
VHERSTTFYVAVNEYNLPEGLSDEEQEEQVVRIDTLVNELEEDLNERIVSWNRKIYRELEDAYEGEMSEESIASTMGANEYKFDENGHRTDDGSFQYAQLSYGAKQRARQWYIEASAGDTYFAEPVLEEWRWLLFQKGFRRIEFAYSGFGSQGDGASFTARHINFREFFRFPDPLEFPECDRNQMSEGDLRNESLAENLNDTVDMKELDPPADLIEQLAWWGFNLISRENIADQWVLRGDLYGTKTTLRVIHYHNGVNYDLRPVPDWLLLVYPTVHPLDRNMYPGTEPEVRQHIADMVDQLVTGPTNVAETAEEDFDFKDAAADAPPKQRWMFQIYKWPTCKALNYFLIEDPNWRYTPGVWDFGETVGGHTFPKHTSDRDLANLAKAQIRQFERTSYYDRSEGNVWQWMAKARLKPGQKMPKLPS